jgi:hypothetical protein
VRERRLAQARRAEQQHVVERLAPAARRLDEDGELLARFLLADIVGEPHRPQRAFELLFLGGGGGRRDQAIAFNGHDAILPDPEHSPLVLCAARA